MIVENKVKEEALIKENTNHEIKLKKLPKKAENKCEMFDCFLYIERKKIDNSKVKWYIVDKTHPEVHTSLSETGLLIVNTDELREKHGSVTIVAKYNKKQYYHILKRWKDKNNKKALALGLGLGLGIPVAAGIIAGIVVGAQSCSSNNALLDGEKGSVKFTSWTNSEKTGLLDWVKVAETTGHFAKSNNWSRTVCGSDPAEIKQFMNDDISIGMIAEGIVLSEKEKGNITEETANYYNIDKAEIRWDTKDGKSAASLDLKLTSKLERSLLGEEEPTLELSATYTFEEYAGNKFGKVLEVNESFGFKTTTSGKKLDHIICEHNESNKITGWTILYKPETEKQTCSSVFISYPNFGNKLTITDGYENVLDLTVQDVPYEMGPEYEYSLNFTLQYDGEDVYTDDYQLFYSDPNLMTGFVDKLDKSIILQPLEYGHVSVTFIATQVVDGVKRVGATTLEIEITDIPLVLVNEITLTWDAGGETISLMDNIDPNELCTTSGVITVHTSETETRDINCTDIKGVKIQLCDETKTTLGNNFLSGADNLIDADFRGLKNVISIGDNFLDSCKAISYIDISDMLSLTSIGNNFLNSCEYLYRLYLPNAGDPANIPTLTSWGVDIAKVNSSTTVTIDCGSDDITAAYKANSVWHNTNEHFDDHIITIRWTPLVPTGNNYIELVDGTRYNIADTLSINELCDVWEDGEISVEIEPYGAEYKTIAIEEIKTVVIKTVNESWTYSHDIVERFHADAINLETLDITALTEISSTSRYATIWDDFLSGCISLTYVDLSTFTSLGEVKDNFLDNLESVTTIKLPNVDPTAMPSLISWGNNIGKEVSTPVNLVCSSNELLAAYQATSGWKDTDTHFPNGVNWTVE